MDNAFRSQLLTPVAPKSLAKTPQAVYPISAETLEKARAEQGPLVCDGRGPADDAAKKLLAAIPAFVGKLKKETNPCARGEAKGEASSKGAGLCWNATTAETQTYKLEVRCEGGKVSITLDSGATELDKLYGLIYEYNGSRTLSLLGWDAGERNAVFVKTSLDDPGRMSSMKGSFFAFHLPYFPAADREMIPTVTNFTTWELFMVDGAKEGYVVRAPSASLLGRDEVSAAAFLIE